MRWQGSVNFPQDLAYIVSPNQIAGLDGIFYTCKSNNGIYILDSTSVATPIENVIIQVNANISPLSAPGRFIKINDVFINSFNNTPQLSEIPTEISMAIIKGTSNGVFMKISDQIIQIGQWPAV